MKFSDPDLETAAKALTAAKGLLRPVDGRCWSCGELSAAEGCSQDVCAAAIGTSVVRIGRGLLDRLATRAVDRDRLAGRIERAAAFLDSGDAEAARAVLGGEGSYAITNDGGRRSAFAEVRRPVED